jgi:hypothetical protein
MSIVILLAMGTDASSQDQESQDQLELAVSALGEYEGFLYFDRQDPNLFNGRNALRFLPEADLDVSRVARLEGAVELRKDFIDSLRIFSTKILDLG